MVRALIWRNIEELGVEVKKRFIRALRRAGIEIPARPGGGSSEFTELFREAAEHAPEWVAYLGSLGRVSGENVQPYVVDYERMRIIYRMGDRYASREEVALAGSVLEALGLASMTTSFKVPICRLGRRIASERVLVRFACPSCGGTDIFKTELIYHRLCGYVGEKFRFEEKAVEEGKLGGLACPSCGRPIESEGEYEVMATVYHCTGCGATFSKPQIKYYCLAGAGVEEEVGVEKSITPRIR